MPTSTAKPTEPTPAPEPVMHMLEEHVPIALLCDLTTPNGPTSAEILAQEGAPENQWWVQ